MRKLLVICLIILVLVVGLPWTFGYFFKMNYYQMLRAISTQDQTHIDVIEYKRGWFSSHAIIHIDQPIQFDTAGIISPPDTPYHGQIITVSLTIEQDISHGPIIYDAINHRWKIAEAGMLSRVHYAPKIENILLRNKTHHFMQVFTIARFNGIYNNFFESPGFTIVVPQIAKIQWQGLKGDFNMMFNGHQIQRIKSNFDISTITTQANNNVFISQAADVFEDIVFSPIGLWDGNYTLSIPEFEIRNAGVSTKISKFNIQSNFNTDKNNLFSSSLDLSIDNLAIYSFTAHPITIKLFANYLDAKGLVNFIRTSYLLLKDNNNLTQQSAQYYELLTKLVTQKTVVNIDIDFFSILGNAFANVEITWPPQTPLPTHINELFAKSNFKISFRLSTSLANPLIEYFDNTILPNQKTNLYTLIHLLSPTPSNLLQISPPPIKAKDIRDTVDEMIKKGYIIQDKNDYRFEVMREQNIIKLNGKKLQFFSPLTRRF